MRLTLIVFAVLSGLSCPVWLVDGISQAASPLGYVRASQSLALAGASVALTLMCGFGAAVLGKLADAERYLRDIRDRLSVVAATAVTATPAAQPVSYPPNPAYAANPPPGPVAGGHWVNPKYAPRPKLGEETARREPKL